MATSTEVEAKLFRLEVSASLALEMPALGKHHTSKEIMQPFVAITYQRENGNNHILQGLL
jgi:hypothetical protein